MHHGTASPFHAYHTLLFIVWSIHVDLMFPCPAFRSLGPCACVRWHDRSWAPVSCLPTFVTSFFQTPNWLAETRFKINMPRRASGWTIGRVLSYAMGHVLNDMCASTWFSYLLIFLHKVCIKRLSYSVSFVYSLCRQLDYRLARLPLSCSADNLQMA